MQRKNNLNIFTTINVLSAFQECSWREDKRRHPSISLIDSTTALGQSWRLIYVMDYYVPTNTSIPWRFSRQIYPHLFIFINTNCGILSSSCNVCIFCNNLSSMSIPVYFLGKKAISRWNEETNREYLLHKLFYLLSLHNTCHLSLIMSMHMFVPLQSN